MPGMVAAMTPLPVIGVPVKGSCLARIHFSIYWLYESR
ncbi:hypothetical protein [Psychrobacter sp. W2-37-MNA-CIBAN-0211]